MTKRPRPNSRLSKLDRQIVELLNQRAVHTLQPEDTGGQAVPAMTDNAVLAAAAAANSGPLTSETIANVFRELLSGIRAADGLVRVAYLGPEYTYSHIAAIHKFGQSAELTPVGSIAAVFEEVERGHAKFGVVPIENSTDGRVADALECLSHSPLQICGEAPLRIHHCLLGRGPRSAIRRVCSKPQALSQCRNWLSAHLPAAALEPTASTAEAAGLAAAAREAAAIASAEAAANHGLDVLARNIEDNPENITRFAVIGREAAKRSGKDKTALVFETPHEPGALADAMVVFKRQRLNLTWIESFPIPRARGRYSFFVEFQGHPSELRAKRAIAALEKKTLRLVVLGSYAENDVIG
jgi:chorismate mutase/prephenate dehydratase